MWANCTCWTDMLMRMMTTSNLGEARKRLTMSMEANHMSFLKVLSDLRFSLCSFVLFRALVL